MLVRFTSKWGKYAAGDVGDFEAPDAKRLIALHLARLMNVGESKVVEAPPKDKQIRSARKAKKAKSVPEPVPAEEPLAEPEPEPEPERRSTQKGSDE